MIQNIAVIGAGTMGCRIAHTFAAQGLQVSIFDAFEAARASAMGKIQQDLEFLIAEGVMDAETAEKTVGNIKLCNDLASAVEGAEYVIECIFEDIKLKQELFVELDKLCDADTLITSNTSSLPLSEMIRYVPEERKAKTMICHWYNPAHLVPIVELTKFGNMSEADFQTVYELYVRTGKKPVCVLKDVPGMVANRLLHALARESFSLVEQGVASAEDIDTALKFGPGFRAATTGMLEAADMGGLDIWCATEESLFPNLCNAAQPCELMRSRVEQGKVGIKAGEGFFSYPEEKRQQAQNDFFRRLIIQGNASKNYP